MVDSQGHSSDLPSTSSGRLRLLRGVPNPQQDDAGPHILLAVDQLPRNLGGGERVLLRLARLLPRYGFRVSVLTLAADPESDAFREPVACPIYLLDLRSTHGRQAVRAALELRRFLRGEKVALVQTFFESSDLWVGPMAKLLAGTPVIWSRRDMGILRGAKHRIAYRWMKNLPERVFAVSEQVRQHCIEVDGISPDRVETVYNGLDLPNLETLPDRGSSTGPPVIKTVGNIRRVKGHDIFVRAAAQIAKQFPDARFSVGGAVLEPEFKAELHALVREQGIGDRFSFDGSVSDLHSYLADATVFVLPSRSEGFSNAIIEAMAAGLPLVATDVGGNAEAIQDGVNGFLVPSEDVDALADALRRLLADPARAQAMGKAGRARVAERFTTEAMMKQLVTAYRRILGGA